MLLDFENENSEFYLGAILAEIRTHLDALHSFLHNVSPDEFSQNAMMQDAVLLRIMEHRTPAEKGDWYKGHQ